MRGKSKRGEMRVLGTGPVSVRRHRRPQADAPYRAAVPRAPGSLYLSPLYIITALMKEPK